ncbi:probable F-box protein At4g22030 [Telopea speciosissima]|uniref:probable F-box protein At4g22030 n=1 Tax=Telopea speciosissima TaxID=54955 RepID=UPI001CC5B687|nr:probable F-box protein At4g22030 [Telopea speciosissima]
MASLRASLLLSSASSSSSSSSFSCKRRIMATFQPPKLGRTVTLKNNTNNLGLLRIEEGQYTTLTNTKSRKTTTIVRDEEDSTVSTATFISELYLIADAVADRVEMHTNVGEQRDNWNTLLLTSINTIILTAATMVALSGTTTLTSFLPFPPLNLSSTLLFSAAAGMMVVMNKIQPSQLAEEQRNAARLFKQLHREIQTTLAIGKTPTARDVKDAMEKVLALDRAYPLPLLGVMLDKFPATVEPTVWWPSPSPNSPNSPREQHDQPEKNGWSEKLEEEMREIVRVLKRKDGEEYKRLGKLALKINKILAVSGPLLAGVAAVGSAFVGSSPSHHHGGGLGLGVAVSVAAGALASVVNTLEHGGQVGMVFEMYRNSAGFFKLLEESIEATLNQKDVEKRENGESFELKVALNLGRSLSELRDLASHASSTSNFYYSCSRDEEASDEFASKLF